MVGCSDACLTPSASQSVPLRFIATTPSPPTQSLVVMLPVCLPPPLSQRLCLSLSPPPCVGCCVASLGPSICCLSPMASLSLPSHTPPPSLLYRVYPTALPGTLASLSSSSSSSSSLRPPPCFCLVGCCVGCGGFNSISSLPSSLLVGYHLPGTSPSPPSHRALTSHLSSRPSPPVGCNVFY
jgi:hypothetical protein